MNNKLSDLNNYLFECIERIMDEDEEEGLNREINRAKTVSEISKTIIEGHKTTIQAVKAAYDMGADVKMPNEVLQISGGGK